MKARVFLSINLVAVSLLLLLLPERSVKKGQPSPLQQLRSMEQPMETIDADRAAMIINQTDPNYQFIDVRSSEEFLASSLPGAINIPFDELMAPQWQGYLKPEQKTNVLYSNGDYLSNMAVAFLSSKGYPGNITLKGGLNEWYEVVMNSEFKGGNLTARENALYGNRANARKLFTEINSLPDSLKNNFLEAKLLAEIELDGGCE